MKVAEDESRWAAKNEAYLMNSKTTLTKRPVLIAFKLGVAPTQVSVALKQLAKRGVI